MLRTIRAVVHEGKIELLEPADLQEGTQVLVTLLADDESHFWLQASQSTLTTSTWDNDEDDIYARLLEE